jgi:hypothetical protein
VTASSKLLLMEEEWAVHCKGKLGGALSSGKGDGRGKIKQQKKKGETGPCADDQCHKCGKKGHFPRTAKPASVGTVVVVGMGVQAR